MTAFTTAKGGLDTTRKGWRGSQRSDASAWTTLTGWPPKRSWRIRARWRLSSMAMTLAPASTNTSVIAP
jgi:hypothetical protein